MNVIEFRVEGPVAPIVYPHMDILIDGINLIELARVVELPLASLESSPSIAGAYAGLLERDLICWPSTHFLGAPHLQWFSDGDTVLLGCECREWECWPLTAQVEVTEQTVTWSGFRNGRRHNWDLSALGPFVFDRQQYEATLRRTAASPRLS
ncbi:hypothetical protein ACFLIM_36445 [Nonomuraea sp. M3C6]|uniref:Uncharacterized protein n=1 Tax=Nonomuraea marmarensis TaxID=3351344 RepID=A0ABW7AMT4_9ACTN